MTTSAPVKIFSLAEANAAVPLVATATEEAVDSLEGIRHRLSLDPLDPEAEMPESVMTEVKTALAEWSEKIRRFGAAPKGYFTVDFQSLDPELLYCWTYGEEKILYTHKTWENFAHRKPLSEVIPASPDHLKWVN
jgi:hypothetical protein